MPGSSPQVSVLLPAYNAASSIEKSVQSILNQTFTDFECLIVNDGSTDETPELVEAFSAMDSRVRLINRPHAGIVPTLNHGIGLAEGRLIARMDADDLAHPERLKKQCGLMMEHPEIGFCGTRVHFRGDKKTATGYHRYVNWTNSLVSTDDILLNRFVESPFSHPSVMFRKEVAEVHGGYRNGDFPEDYELWLRWMDASVKPAKVDEVLLDWLDTPQRLSRTDSRYRQEAFYATKAIYLARWLEQNNPFHPEVCIWGGGRITRRRADHLLRHGIHIKAWIDIHPGRIGKKIGGYPVWSPDDLPGPDEVFVIPYVGSTGAQKLITSHLHSKGYRPGRDYICAA